VQFRYYLLLRAYIGFRRPTRITILGMELAGEIEEVGKDVSKFKIGDEIFAATGFVGMGTCTEYICLPEEGGDMDAVVVLKPTNMTYEEATPVPVGGLEALCFVRQGNVQTGQKVLINGAGGTIGAYAVQIAKHYGAEVTAVDSSEKLDMVYSIGADKVIDYTKEDFIKSGQVYDLILDTVAYRSIFDYIRALSPEGVCLFVGGSMPRVFLAAFLAPFILMTSSKKISVLMWKPNKKEDLAFIKELFEAGKIKPVIDRIYQLNEVAEAVQYLEEKRVKGKLVITMDQNKT